MTTPRRTKTLSSRYDLMAQIRRDPEFRRRCKHEEAVLAVREAMCEQDFHVTRRRKMEEYLDLVYELGFEVRKR